MKIALIPSAYAPAVGGVEELTRQLGLQLMDAGHQVEVWTHRHPAELPRQEEIDGVIVRRFSMPLPAGSPASLLRFVPGSTVALWELRAATRRFNPDLLHVQCFSGNGVYAAALSKLTGIPLVLTLQGETVMDDADIYERSVSLRAGLRAGLRQAAVVSGCSAFVVDDAVKRFGLRAGRGVVVPNGVDVRNDDSPGTELELPFSRFVLGLGRVVHKKGFDFLLDAFADVAARHPDVGLVVGGRGSELDALRRRAAAAGLQDRVVFPGVLGRAEVAWAMRNADLFVMPSRVEPFGIVTLEALESGCPVIVTSIGGASEIVSSGIDGLVVDPSDRSALADSIDRLLDDAEMRERLAQAGRARVKRYAWAQIAAEYLELYKRARSPAAALS